MSQTNRWKMLLSMSVLGASVLVSGGAGVSASAPTTPIGTSVLSVPVGDGAGHVTYTPLLEDLERRGPESFAVAANGDVYLLDARGAQIEVLAANGQAVQALPLPAEMEFFDLEIAEGGWVYALSDTGVVVSYKNGQRMGTQTVPMNAEQMDVLGLYQTNGDVVVRYLDGSEYSLQKQQKKAGHGGYTGKRTQAGIELSNGQEAVTVRYQHQPAGTQPLGKTAGGELLVLENEALLGANLYVESRVTAYKNGRAQATALALPTNEYAVKVPHKFVYAATNGKIYQMVLQHDRVEIVELALSAKSHSRLPDVLKQQAAAPSLTTAQGLVSTEAVNLYGRTTAYDRALAITGYTWTFNAVNRTPTTSTTLSPDFLVSAASGSSQQGIPYTWGGFDALDTSSSKANWTNFANGLSKGKYAGNVDTDGHGWISSTVGLDCSGFVSAIYGFSYKFSTGMLASDPNTPFKPTTYAALLPGDIANDAGSHVWVLVSRKTDTAGNLLGYYTREATVSGTGDKAKYYYRSTTEAQAYVPMTLK